jgi:hypothetical protein
MTTRITLAREGEEVGTAMIYNVPLHRDHDYSCSPPGVLTFEPAKEVAAQLAKERDGGQVGAYAWWESG